MAQYLIGDIQGCHAALQALLQKIDFSPSRDQLYLLGDMVNRGEDSVGVLQTLMRFGSSVQCVLGNHDLHALAVAHGIRALHPSDTLQALLDAPNKLALLDWLRHQPLAIKLVQDDQPWLLVHAGVLPQWDAQQTLQLAAEVQTALQGAEYVSVLHLMYGNAPAQWSDALHGAERLRVIVNGLTRLRFCTAQGVMDFKTKEGADHAPPDHMPWFVVPTRHTQNIHIAFGHWSTLGLLQRHNLLGLDTGYVWGGALTAYDLRSAKLAAISAPKSTISHAR